MRYLKKNLFVIERKSKLISFEIFLGHWRGVDFSFGLKKTETANSFWENLNLFSDLMHISSLSVILNGRWQSDLWRISNLCSSSSMANGHRENEKKEWEKERMCMCVCPESNCKRIVSVLSHIYVCMVTNVDEDWSWCMSRNWYKNQDNIHLQDINHVFTFFMIWR